MISINPKLERYIFGNLNAEYNIDPDGASSNLNNDEEKNRQYLGTYFPRSFVESYKIYSNVFSNKEIFSSVSQKDSIRILDIGSGTGGNLFGLLNAFVQNFSNKKLLIYSFDGNNIALEYQRQILRDLNKLISLNSNRIELKTYKVEFKDKYELQTIIDRLNFDNKLDIVQSFKFVNEFYNTDYKKNKGMYAEFIKGGEKWLSNDGMLLILDVTNTIKNQTFNSIIMNNECRKYLTKNLSRLKYILPTCCAFWYNRCSWNQCFSKKEFHIEHRYAKSDISKVNYKLFIKEPLALKVLKNITPKYCYEVSRGTYCTKDEYVYNCTPPSNDIYDPFLL